VKIVFAIKALGLQGGGAERVLAEVTGELARRGHQVFVLSFDPQGTKPFYPLADGVEHIPLGSGRVERRTGPWSFVQRLRALRSAVRSLSPDVAVGFMHSAYLPLLLARTGVPVIASEHIIYDHYKPLLIEKTALRLATRADAITAISEPMKASFPPAFRRKMAIVRNPVAAATGRADTRDQGTNTLLSVGRIEEQKNHKLLIEAFAELAPEFPNWRLKIVGEGQLRPGLEQRVRELGLSDRIAMPGATPDIAAEYRSAQLFAMPSTYESFGLVTAEALTYGLPVVGLECCAGTNELVRHEVNGLLSDAAGYAGALRRLMGDEGLRKDYGAKGLLEPDKFSIGGVADSWEQLLEAQLPAGRSTARVHR
jgi:glycosyltransferase involved in cell wall biosynthesis